MLGFPFSDVECLSTSGCHTDPPDKKLSKLLIKMVGHLSNIIQPFKALVSALKQGYKLSTGSAGHLRNISF